MRILTGSRGTISPSLVLSRTTGIGPLYVHADCSATLSSQTTAPFFDCLYSIDWGDDTGTKWQYGSFANFFSRAITYGPVAGHIYIVPGTYTVTLTVYDGASLAYAQNTVTVSDPEVAYTGTNNICFSTTADFTGAPAGSQQVTLSDYSTAINTYQANNKRLMFHDGQAFTQAARAQVAKSGMTITTFGAGAAAKFIASQNEGIMLGKGATDPTFNDLRLFNIEIDGNSGSSFGILGGGPTRRMTIYNMNIHHTRSCIECGGGEIEPYNSPAFTYGMHPEWGIFDCYLHDSVGGLGGIGVYLTNEKLGFYGNRVFNHQNTEHCIRTPGQWKSAISFNETRNPFTAKHHITLRTLLHNNSNFPNTLHDPDSTMMVCSFNHLNGANDTLVSAWQSQTSASSTTTDVRMNTLIWENNYHTLGPNHTHAHINLTCLGMVFRNNIIDLTLSTGTKVMFDTTWQGSAPNIPPGNVEVYGNTMISNTVAGSHIMVNLGASIDGITVKNNLAYTPVATTRLYINGNAGSVAAATALSSNNSSVAQYLTSPAFVAFPPTTPSDLKITTGSYAKNAGAAIKLYNDFFAGTRVGTGTLDIGAHEFT